jgi:hypothetical protein
MVGKDASMTTPQPAPPHDHQPEPTPDQDGLVAAMAALLLVGASLGLTAAALAALLRRRGVNVSTRSVMLALKLASARTKHQPRMIGRTDVARAQQGMEAHYRAAYVLNAAGRLEAAKDAALAELEFRAVQDGRELSQAERDKAEAAAYSAAANRERAYEAAHERARRRRMEAAVQVAEAANRWGMTLGWWHTPRRPDHPGVLRGARHQLSRGYTAGDRLAWHTPRWNVPVSGRPPLPWDGHHRRRNRLWPEEDRMSLAPAYVSTRTGHRQVRFDGEQRDRDADAEPHLDPAGARRRGEGRRQGRHRARPVAGRQRRAQDRTLSGGDQGQPQGSAKEQSRGPAR